MGSSVSRSGRIEICGGIASGKTTLANLLHAYGVAAVLERFEENPFWASFYTNPGRYAFETEITFLLQHYSQMRDAHDHHQVFVYDSSLIQDLAYARANLDDAMLNAFLAVHECARRALRESTLLVHLICEPAIELARIRSRRRPQEATIQIGYLMLLNEQVRVAVSEIKSTVRVIEIDSGAHNFANDSATRKFVAQSLVVAINQPDGRAGRSILSRY